MSVPKYKFVLTVGEDSEKIFQWKDHRKQPIPLSGYRIDCNLYSDATTQFASLSTTNGGILIDSSTNGKFTIFFDSELTQIKLSNMARYEIWLTDSAGKKKCFLVGGLSFVRACD